METGDDRLPVNSLTGFLGAGKNALLNNLILDPKAGRIAVTMNKFGDVGLDREVICARLNTALIDTQEFEPAAWAKLPDPFPRWQRA